NSEISTRKTCGSAPLRCHGSVRCARSVARHAKCLVLTKGALPCGSVSCAGSFLASLECTTRRGSEARQRAALVRQGWKNWRIAPCRASSRQRPSATATAAADRSIRCATRSTPRITTRAIARPLTSGRKRNSNMSTEQHHAAVCELTRLLDGDLQEPE